MDSVSSILSKVLHRRGLHGQAQASQITFLALQWLKEALPACVAESVGADHFKDGVLSLTSDNAVAAQECHNISSDLIDFLTRTCPSVPVREIRIVRSRH